MSMGLFKRSNKKGLAGQMTFLIGGVVAIAIFSIIVAMVQLTLAKISSQLTSDTLEYRNIASC